MVELAITVGDGEPFDKAIYSLEGDGPLVFTCYEKIIRAKSISEHVSILLLLLSSSNLQMVILLC